MIDFTCRKCDDPNFIAAELPDDVRAAARSLGQSPQAALEHRLGSRAINTYRPNPNGRLYIKDNRLILPGDEPPARPQGTSHGQ